MARRHSSKTAAAGPVEQALAEVKAIYAELGRRPVERACIHRTECCQFRRTGLTPQVTLGEVLLAARGWRATGRTRLPEKSDGSCPALDPATGRCRIYDSRPFGCRTHFCETAGGPYVRRDVADLIRRLEAVDQWLRGDGPRAFPEALADALDDLA